MRSFVVLLVLVALNLIWSAIARAGNEDEILRDIRHENSCAFDVALSRLAAQDLPLTRRAALVKIQHLLSRDVPNPERVVGDALFKSARSADPELRQLAHGIIIQLAQFPRADSGIGKFLAEIMQQVDATLLSNGMTSKEMCELVHGYLKVKFTSFQALTSNELRREIARIDLSPFGKANPPPAMLQIKLWALRRLAKRGHLESIEALIQISQRYEDLTLLWGVPDTKAIDLAKLWRQQIIYEMERAEKEQGKSYENFLQTMFEKYSKYYPGNLELGGPPELDSFLPLRDLNDLLLRSSLDIYFEVLRNPKISPFTKTRVLESILSLKRSEADADPGLTELYLGFLNELDNNPVLGNPHARATAAARLRLILNLD